ncbi:hypothetical protein IJL65_02985 [bacterium]|nr:hypothetical protein [bacterium]
MSAILQSQNKTILNTKEIKKAYLQNLRIEKSENSITTEQYFSAAPAPEIKNTPS